MTAHVVEDFDLARLLRNLWWNLLSSNELQMPA